MSRKIIQDYYNKVERIKQYGGSHNENQLRSAFEILLSQLCPKYNLELINNLPTIGKPIIPDGTLRDPYRQDRGYWESKDEYDVLDDDIKSKIEKGYPTSNILFEDGKTAVLFQNGEEVGRVSIISDPIAFDSLLTEFLCYERAEVRTFHEAIERFKSDLPDLIDNLRNSIENQATVNNEFRQSQLNFLELCRTVINPALVPTDIREMIIQHILTEDIFITIFNNPDFHRENNIARELSNLTQSFFKGDIRRNILLKIEPYIEVIKAAASNIYDYHEKQRFLKVVYENFYKAYNRKGADRLGIIYTPNEIVRFMVDATEFLTLKHFGSMLQDRNVDILDPCAGTGTFVTDIIEHIPNNLLPYKYNTEIHCNEVAILPYYIANLNIEYTYYQKMGTYAEFKNICFVDTLDNLGFDFKGKQYQLSSISDDNVDRIKKQNARKICVIIGNPPYNANQLNENENNKNREYPEIDKSIKETYIKYSTAQKTKLYDMYSRFIRWGTNRLQKDGVLAFITNSSFIDARTYDGFRKVVNDEFTEIYIIDLGGNVRNNPRLSGTKHNVFGIQTGVAIMLFVKKAKRQKQPCKIYYTRRPEMETAKEKLEFLASTKFESLCESAFEHIRPDRNNNWVNLSENNWDTLLPLASKEVKTTKSIGDKKAIFKLFSLGVVTNRDDWVYDLTSDGLSQKVRFLIDFYNKQMLKLSKDVQMDAVNNLLDYTIKWTRSMKKDLAKGVTYDFQQASTRDCLYRPFIKRKLYFNRQLNEMQYQNPSIFPAPTTENKVIFFNGSNAVSWNPLASKIIVDLNALYGGAQCLPLYRYDDGHCLDNITDWALNQFRNHYSDANVTKESIFNYVYAVLHHPEYREKYAQNLKREFPHIPLYDNFSLWKSLGERLMGLHLNFDSATPYALKRMDKVTPSPIRPKLKVDKGTGNIEVDNITTLINIPSIAWHYKIGNRSAMEWVLEYYKERKPRDPTVRNKFDTYRFADYKEQVIELIQRVCTVSVETMRIIEEMPHDK